MLQKVTQRWPVGHCQTHDSSSPAYVTCHFVETLACGHKLTTYPQSDPGIATRRNCLECDGIRKVPRKPPTKAQVIEMPAAVNFEKEPRKQYVNHP